MSSLPEIRAALARNALAVCQTYLPNGRRSGNHWMIGDIQGNKGRSLHVRLRGPDTGPGSAGKWTDESTGEHGDLLDIIAASKSLSTFPETLDEARRFLSLPQPASRPSNPESDFAPSRRDAAHRLFKSARPIFGSLAEIYLRTGRAITGSLQYDTLRYHPNCYHRAHADVPLLAFPALLAAITDLTGRFTGVHRTWLSPDGLSMAPLEDTRRAMGNMIGNAVRFGTARHVLIAGEGLETMLSLRSVLPSIPAAAALTANHLMLLKLPSTLQRLYVALDNDPAGDMAWQSLSETARSQGISPFPLVPALDDWNGDLKRIGFAPTLALALSQLHPEDRP